MTVASAACLQQARPGRGATAGAPPYGSWRVATATTACINSTPISEVATTIIGPEQPSPPAPPSSDPQAGQAPKALPAPQVQPAL